MATAYVDANWYLKWRRHRPLAPPPGPRCEPATGGFFESDQQALIGLSGDQRPFRVFALSNPARVVVDVHHG
ncbi:MAG TPA: hypothetical protein VFJ28_07915 [Marmoricola sp.]|nr:hypothetical protein [Marmoricola sp.]